MPNWCLRNAGCYGWPAPGLMCTTWIRAAMITEPLIERACAWGGEGTTGVSEYCAAELGALQGTGIMAARALIADALDVGIGCRDCGVEC